MRNDSKRALRIGLGVATLGCCLFMSDDLTFTGPQRPLVNQAQAYIGNPLTPLSFAGVARRTARRTAYAYGAYAYGAYAYGAPYRYGAPYPYVAPYPYGYAPAPGYPPPGYVAPPGYPPPY
jgi:hypothetical protein